MLRARHTTRTFLLALAALGLALSTGPYPSQASGQHSSGVLASSAAAPRAQTAPSRWSTPALVSTTTWTSWFPDIAVDNEGRAYLVWASGTTQRGVIIDQVLYSMWDGIAWARPNDIFAPSTGGFNVRPAIAVDSAGLLHIVYRENTVLRYTQAPAGAGGGATSWSPGWRISGANNGYYSTLALDNLGTIHVVWNEIVPDTPTQAVVWFGTDNGAARRIEEEWELYPTTGGIANGTVYAIMEDTSGNQWLGTDNGVLQYNGVHWMRLRVGDGLTDNHVYSLYEDHQGGIWFGTGRGVNGYAADDKGWKIYTQEHGLAHDKVNAITQDQQGVLWFGTDGGLSAFDGDGWITYTVASGLPGNTVLALHEDRLGYLWVGTDSGLSRRDGEKWETFTTAEGLAGNRINDILEDRQGVLWFATDHGVSRLERSGEIVAAGSGELPVYSALLDSDDVYWFGTDGGALRYDGKAGSVWEKLDVPAPSGRGQAGKVLALAGDELVNALCPSCSDIFYRRSTDNGATWSAAVNLSRSPEGSTKPQIKLDAAGGVHVTWDEGWDFYTGRGSPQAVAYAHSLDDGVTWAQPQLFRARNSAGKAQQITLGVAGDGQLVAVWRVQAGLKPESREVFYQTSRDRGNTWSAPTRMEDLVAREWLSGHDNYTMVTDSAGRVHLALVTQTTEAPIIYQVVHLEWDGTSWSQPEPVFVTEDVPEWPRLAIGGGNQVFLTWFVRAKDDLFALSAGRYKVWAAHMRADAPHVAPTPPPTRTPALPTPTAAPPSPTPFFVNVPGDGPPDGLSGRPNLDANAVSNMLVAALPAAVWLGLVALGVRRLRRRT
jgi:sugar lactone lactonase YvrE